MYERLLLWRGFVIYLIGGSSHVGKTLLAQRLMEQTKYPYTSLDHLKMGFIRSRMTDLTVDDDEQMSTFMWPFVREIIKTAIENEQNMIIEGCYIPVDFRSSFSKEECLHIKPLFIVMSETYIKTHFKDISGYANAIEKRLDDKPDMERLITCSANFQKECEEYGEPYYLIDTTFDVNDILKRLLLAV